MTVHLEDALTLANNGGAFHLLWNPRVLYDESGIEFFDLLVQIEECISGLSQQQ
jgi:hypothetical protein